MGSIIDLNDKDIEELIILSIATNPWAQVVIFSRYPPGSSFTQNLKTWLDGDGTKPKLFLFYFAISHLLFSTCFVFVRSLVCLSVVFPVCFPFIDRPTDLGPCQHQWHAHRRLHIHRLTFESWWISSTTNVWHCSGSAQQSGRQNCTSDAVSQRRRSIAVSSSGWLYVSTR